MKNIYKYHAIIFTCIVSLVIIISRASNELIQRHAPQTLLNLSQRGLPSEEPEEEEDMDTYNHSGGHNKHILILAARRTGSSFVGEFFNQNGDNMFYLYEPLWHVQKAIEGTIGVATSEAAEALIQKDVLRGLFLCDFTPLEKFMRLWPQSQDHMTPTLFRRESSVSLCKEPVCTPVVEDVGLQCKTQSCGPLNLTLASESCLTKEHHAIKVVRVNRLDSLRPLVEDPRLDVRVIQLVRDPRAMVASRMEALTNKYNYKKWKEWVQLHGQVPDNDTEVRQLRGECERARASAMAGLRQPRWLRRRYMLLRYEDVARYPVQKAEEMYRFAGIPFSSQAREWIRRNTNAVAAAAGDVFSTERNSSEQADKWRFSLPYELAQVVQRVCGPTMELFGYSFVDDEKTLVNGSVSLLDPSYLM